MGGRKVIATGGELFATHSLNPLKCMNVIKNVTDSYKKNPVIFIGVSLVVLTGLIYSWKLTIFLVVVIYLGIKFKKDDKKKEGTKKLCPHCKTEIDWSASRCPNCHGKMSVWTVGNKMIAVILLPLIFYGIIFATSNQPSSVGNTITNTSEDREILSIVFAKSVIEGILKAPSTAKFVDVNAYELSNLKDVWAINGYVDSQNSFGAMIRNQWEVQLDYRDGKGGTVKSVLFDGKKIQ